MGHLPRVEVRAPPAPPALPSFASQSSLQLRGKGRVHPEPSPPPQPSQSSSDATSSTAAHTAAVPMAAGRRPSVESDEKVRRIMNKLQRLTGRRDSLEEIGPLLNPRTADEAYLNGRLIRAADHFKRVYGTRPATTAAAAAGTSGGGGDVDEDDVHVRRRSRSQNQLPTQQQQPVDRKIDKLTRLTGRRSSLAEIVGLLAPQTPDEAMTNAQSLYQMEHLKKRYGQRPSLAQAKKTSSFEATVVVSPRAMAVPKSPSMPSLSSSEDVADQQLDQV